MGYTQNFTKAHKWFIGDDVTLELEVFADDGLAITDPNKTMVDVTGLPLAFSLKRNVTDDDADAVFPIKRTGGEGITVTGVYALLRSANTQRVLIAIRDEDTDDLVAGKYFHALKRMTDNAEHTMMDGYAELLKGAGPRT